MIGLKLQFPHGFCWETVLAMIECLHADFFSQKIQTKHPFIAIVKNSDLKMPSDGWAHEANRWTHQGLLGVGGIRIFTQCGGMRYRLLHEVVFSPTPQKPLVPRRNATFKYPKNTWNEPFEKGLCLVNTSILGALVADWSTTSGVILEDETQNVLSRMSFFLKPRNEKTQQQNREIGHSSWW